MMRMVLLDYSATVPVIYPPVTDTFTAFTTTFVTAITTVTPNAVAD